MTDHLHRTISLQRLDGAPGSAVIVHLASVPGLVAHVGLLLVTTSGLVLVNLLVNPESQWAGAILVVWLLVLVAHGLGIVIARLMSDETTSLHQAAPSASESENGWAHPGASNAGETTVASDHSMTDSWKDVAAPEEEAETSWPSVVTAQPAPEESVDGDLDGDSAGANESGDQRVPWRAATEIAWLRKWHDAIEEDQPQERNSAS